MQRHFLLRPGFPIYRINAAIILLLAAGLAACTSTRLQDAMPEAAEAPAQITPTERDALLAEIDAARAGQRPGGRTRVELSPEELRAIARGHGDEALEAIEAE